MPAKHGGVQTVVRQRIDEGGEKIRNLDAMLAQLCTLDRALDEKSKRNKRTKTESNERSSGRSREKKAEKIEPRDGARKAGEKRRGAKVEVAAASTSPRVQPDANGSRRIREEILSSCDHGRHANAASVAVAARTSEKSSSEGPASSGNQHQFASNGSGRYRSDQQPRSKHQQQPKSGSMEDRSLGLSDEAERNARGPSFRSRQSRRKSDRISSISDNELNMDNDDAYDEDALRSRLSAISIADEVEIGSPECQHSNADPRAGFGKRQQGSGVVDSVEKGPKPEPSDIFGPKKTSACQAPSAAGDLENLESRGEGRAAITGNETAATTTTTTAAAGAGEFAGEGKQQQQRKGESPEDEGNCRVIVIKAPKISAKEHKKKKSSRRHDADKDLKSNKDREKSTKEKRPQKDKKEKSGSRKKAADELNSDLTIPFEKYITGHAIAIQQQPQQSRDERSRRREAKKMLETRAKASSSDEGIARSPSKSRGERKSSRPKTKDKQRRSAEAKGAAKDHDKAKMRDEAAWKEEKRYQSTRTAAPEKERSSRPKSQSAKTDKVATSRRANQQRPAKDSKRNEAYPPPSRATRMAEAASWHTKVYDAQTFVRPERRGNRSNKAEERRRPASSPSDLSASSFSSVSSDSDSSSYASSSGSTSPTEERRTRVAKQHGRAAHRAPSPARPRGNGHPRPAKPRYPKSASSTSSFQRRPAAPQPADDQFRRKNKRLDPVPSGRRAGIEERDRRGSSPEDPELQFGSRRKKRNNASLKDEGEETHSLWQHHQLVVVSQKPDSLHSASGRSKGAETARLINSKQPAAVGVQKKPVVNSSSVGSVVDKRSLTIRDLYSLHNVLSDTQNGTVISGYRRADGLRVAIKRISKAGTTRWGWLSGKVVPLELALLCQVNEVRSHGIVEIVEWHETTEAFLLVMVRPHPAVDLYDYVSKRKRVKEPVARHIIRQLIASLQHCIKCGVLHRDVKLENILLNPETIDVTLIDFGCGDYIRNSCYKEFAGTPEYYPPEWFSRKQYHGDSMTVWSIGVLLYSLLCGSLPFRSSKEIAEKELSKFPSDVSRGAREIIGTLLQKNPNDRPSLSNVLGHAWLSKSAAKTSST